MTRVLLVGLGLLSAATALAQPQPDASDAFFKGPSIPKLRIEIVPPEAEKLKADPRSWVRCTIVENGKTTWTGAGIKLKGAAGSFRDLDDKPAFTVRVDKFEAGGSFHGLKKFHLNNSVQDGSYLHELVSGEIFRAGGVPATRVAHARVWLNDRDLGFYVLKEGFDSEFLERHFKPPPGNLYDGGFCQDVDAPLEKDSGGGPDDRSDLQALLEAAREPDAARRRERLAAALDIEPFITFMALEMMIGHWDGYTLNRNNYRLYFDPAGPKARFLPHGTDQVFGDAGASILDMPPAIVASAVMKFPDWRARYRKRIGELLPLFQPEKLHRRIDEVAARLRPVLKAISAEEASAHADRVRELKDRIAARAANLKEQQAQPDPKPLALAPGASIRLRNWRPASEVEDARLEEVRQAGERSYVIRCGPKGKCIASWRKNVLLPRGRYRLQATARTQDVVALPGDPPPSAAGIRASGGTRDHKLSGSSAWKPLESDFEVAEDSKDVELVVELRSSKGEAWFLVDSLRLTRLKP